MSICSFKLNFFMNVEKVICLKIGAGGDDHEGGNYLAWLRDSVPGEPGVDYPILYSPDPDTSFSCRGLVSGQ